MIWIRKNCGNIIVYSQGQIFVNLGEVIKNFQKHRLIVILGSPTDGLVLLEVKVENTLWQNFVCTTIWNFLYTDNNKRQVCIIQTIDIETYVVHGCGTGEKSILNAVLVIEDLLSTSLGRFLNYRVRNLEKVKIDKTTLNDNRVYFCK